MRLVLAAALSLLSVPALAETPQALAERLDLTSFPNSTGPRRDVGLFTFSDFGFTAVEADGPVVRFADPEDGWTFIVTLLEPRNGRQRLCVEDKAENGGSYHTRHAYEVVEGRTGLVHATATRVTDPKCVALGE